MFKIDDNTIEMAINSPEKINLWIQGEDGKVIFESGHIKRGWYTNNIYFKSDNGKVNVLFDHLKKSCIAWSWHKNKKITV